MMDGTAVLCDEFAGMPAGTVVRFVEGTDFTTVPGTFRNKLHRMMRERGLLVQTMLKGPEVYAKVSGPIAPPAPPPAPAPAVAPAPAPAAAAPAPAPAAVVAPVLGDPFPRPPAAPPAPPRRGGRIPTAVFTAPR